MQRSSHTTESPRQLDAAGPLPAVAWVMEFARHLQGLGATDHCDMLRDLGERFYPAYQRLDPSAVADSVWSKWPADTNA